MRIILINILLLLACVATAQEKGHYLTIEGNGGYSSLLYKLDKGKRSPEMGFGLKVGYSYFFNKNWGVSTGVGIAQYKTSGLLNEYSRSHPNQIDSEGDSFIKHLYLHDWKEVQKTTFVELPVLLSFQYLLGEESDWKIYAHAGLKVQLPVKTSYNVERGNIEMQAYYPEWNITLFDLDEQGIERNSNYHPSGDYNLKTSLASTLSLGLMYSLNDKFELYGGATFDYGLNNIRKSKVNSDLISDLGDEGRKYNGMLSSSVSSKINTLSLKMEIGLRFRIGKRKAKNIKEQYDEIPIIVNLVDKDSLKVVDSISESKIISVEEELFDEQHTVNDDNNIQDNKDTEVKENGNKSNTSLIEEDAPQSLDLLSSNVITYNYRLNKYIPGKAQLKLMKQLLPTIKTYPIIRLKGHTCNLGSEKGNLQLGLLRAEYMKKALIKEGIPAGRITISSKGKREPCASNVTMEGRLKNRRVEMYLEN